MGIWTATPLFFSSTIYCLRIMHYVEFNIRRGKRIRSIPIYCWQPLPLNRPYRNDKDCCSFEIEYIEFSHMGDVGPWRPIWAHCGTRILGGGGDMRMSILSIGPRRRLRAKAASHLNIFRSRVRYWMASATWDASMLGLLSRSAMVRAIFNIRACALALRPNLSMAFSISELDSESISQNCLIWRLFIRALIRYRGTLRYRGTSYIVPVKKKNELGRRQRYQ